MSQNVSSAAVVIGALKVKITFFHECMHIGIKKKRLQSLIGRHFGGHHLTTHILRFFEKKCSLERGVLSDSKGIPLNMQYSKTSLYRHHREAGFLAV